jgi:peptide chain release factor 2
MSSTTGSASCGIVFDTACEQAIPVTLKSLRALFAEVHAVAGEIRDLAEGRSLNAELSRIDSLLSDCELRAALRGARGDSNAFVTIRAGAGGVEPCAWAEMLQTLYTRWAERHGFDAGVVEGVQHEQAGLLHVTLRIRGEFVYELLVGEVGIHRLVRTSRFDPKRRRHTSFAAVDVLPDLGPDITSIVPVHELRRDTFRSGAQHL